MTKTMKALLLVAALVLASDAVAQQSPPPPSCVAEEFRRFDFWVGEWVVTNALPPSGWPLCCWRIWKGAPSERQSGKRGWPGKRC